MALKVESATIEAGKRVIVISDIHADLVALKKLLNKVRFTKDDVLVLLGDIVEKGKYSLKTLQYIMKLSETHTVYTVCGNCDAIALEILRDDKNKELLGYILAKKHTLVGDMCRAINISITRDLDMLAIKKVLRSVFEKELSFIQQLPHILELNDYVFAHAAVRPEHPLDMKPSQVMKMDAFMEQGYTFEKYHIVGHWPTVLYSKKIPDCNPRIDREHKIISIDGGNTLKLDGQLNALIIPDVSKEEFSYVYVDLLKKAKILNTQEVGESPFCISWLDSKVDVLRREKEFAYCEHCSSGNKMWIPNSYLWEGKDGFHTEDITNYQLKLTYGDIVSVTKATSRGYLVKKDGVCGWYYGMLEEIPDPDDIMTD
ncbi:MAG: metallophosphoesterase [Clostridiales bacterium]|nr:metallophosphoesterase [Clostridiales bacterium]